ncbi:MAG: diaminopimelate epimerase [Muribaculum sp.]|nr:diaminopimelate epimerase [Muribaculum sp.]
MHGIGNDYVYIDCTDRTPDSLEELAREMSDRHMGVGGDGIILVCPSEVADYRMRIFNADGSEARMCGNGCRCVGKFIFDRKMIDRPWLSLETGAGVRHIDIHVGDDGLATGATVDMGEPRLSGPELPDNAEGGRILRIDAYDVLPVSMGNPHGVVFCDEYPTDQLVLGSGPLLENDLVWPDRANIEFVRIISSDEAEMRVWERGSGETMACGTGACAAAVAGMLDGRLSDRVTMHLRGGDLEIFWDRNGSNLVYLTGDAVEVFEGVYKRKTGSCGL